MTSWAVTGRGTLIGTVVGAVEGAIWWHAEGIAVIHLFLILLVPVPLGAMLAVRARLPRWWVTALAGPLAFAALVQALDALIPSHSAPELPEAFHVLPFVLAGVIGYAAVARIAASHGPRWPRIAAAVALSVLVAVILQGRAAIADWHKERAIAGLDLTVLGLGAHTYQSNGSVVWQDLQGGDLPAGLSMWYELRNTAGTVDIRSIDVTLVPASWGSAEELCTRPSAAASRRTCRPLPGNLWLRADEYGPVSVTAQRQETLIEVSAPSEAEARAALADLRPVTAQTVASYR
ncbi:hypothetical protein Ppa06_39880 [Planomonospora parontospora subsp. parontospora]|uniref:Uncharacterized protein n=3 Tax=Planomonospora parontospora TaxID=58119 RepID=A0AA37F5E0_9ACTN|nr:hypothetical protein GCM10010126_39040 [Planomonospora parontospora]GII10190.1 hypothetical protein Ppa06_39880 [Planomonospora parontospora subsp. parontospora]